MTLHADPEELCYIIGIHPSTPRDTNNSVRQAIAKEDISEGMSCFQGLFSGYSISHRSRPRLFCKGEHGKTPFSHCSTHQLGHYWFFEESVVESARL